KKENEDISAEIGCIKPSCSLPHEIRSKVKSKIYFSIAPLNGY
ncbi:MAG: hypothetical protein ACI9KF_001381, partial [Arenicella sp.]